MNSSHPTSNPDPRNSKKEISDPTLVSSLSRIIVDLWTSFKGKHCVLTVGPLTVHHPTHRLKSERNRLRELSREESLLSSLPCHITHFLTWNLCSSAFKFRTETVNDWPVTTYLVNWRDKNQKSRDFIPIFIHQNSRTVCYLRVFYKWH